MPPLAPELEGEFNRCAIALRIALLVCILPAHLAAQDLEPRAYAVSPVGLNAVVAAYGHIAGDVLFDPSLPVEDVSATIHSIGLGYYRAIGLFGRSANIRVAMPYALGHMQGLLSGADTQIYRSGLGDVRVQLSANLIGAPKMDLRQFAEYRRGTTLWASLAMIAPTGQYDPAKLINIGTNRWAFKPEMALSHVIGNWTLEGYAGAWLFTKNPKFQVNQERQQAPLYSYQGHLSRNFKRALWWAGDVTYYHGGASRVAGVQRQDFLRTVRIGLTVSVPVKKLQSLKFSYARSTYARVGGKFNTISVVYAYSWK